MQTTEDSPVVLDGTHSVDPDALEGDMQGSWNCSRSDGLLCRTSFGTPLPTITHQLLLGPLRLQARVFLSDSMLLMQEKFYLF